MNSNNINNSAHAPAVKTESDKHANEIEQFLRKHYDFRYNIVLGRLEYKVKGETNFRLLFDYDENSILRRLKSNSLRISVTSLREVLLSDFTITFDPFVDYLTNLPVWDESVDHIGLLASTVKTTDDELWGKFLRKWLVALVANLLEPEEVNQTVLVFYGGQGEGKTTWIEKLVPTKLKKYLFTGTVNPSDKDAMIHLAECMLINLDELENLNRSEVGSLKSLITQKYINIRRPYGRNSETLTRRASFAGSINNSQFLNDSTGSRRFLVSEVKSINYKHKVDIDMVLSQALHLFKHGFQYWFDKEEQLLVNENNAQYQRVNLEEESLLDSFEPAKENDPEAVYLTTTEIANRLKEKYGVRTDASALNLLGKALAKHDFIRLKRQSAYRYCLKQKKTVALAVQPEFSTMKVA